MSQISFHALNAINALEESWFINWIIRGSIHDPAMGGTDHHPNWRLYGSMEWYLSCRQIAHAGDVVNAYCQLILGEILSVDSKVWDSIKKLLKSKDILTAIGKLNIQGENDSYVRRAIRENLATYWSPEVEIIVELRNKIVHQQGIDPEGKIQKTVQEFPVGGSSLYPADLIPGELPFSQQSDGRLIIDAKTGHWASRHAGHFIHLLDQELVHSFPIPSTRMRIRGKKYTTSTPGGLPQPPGTSLPISPPTHPPLPVMEALEEFPHYHSMLDAEDKNCIETWRIVRNEIDKYVRSYSKECGIAICKIDAGLRGRFSGGRSLEHDHHLGYHMRPVDDEHGDILEMGIRLRQKDKIPFITIWTNKIRMKDFDECDLSENLKEFLRVAIDDALR